MELLVKPESLASSMYRPTFGNAESRLFLFAAQCFNIESMQKVSCGTVLCKHFASHRGYSNYRWDFNTDRKSVVNFVRPLGATVLPLKGFS
jgi:hypothetical protein